MLSTIAFLKKSNKNNDIIETSFSNEPCILYFSNKLLNKCANF